MIQTGIGGNLNWDRGNGCGSCERYVGNKIYRTAMCRVQWVVGCWVWGKSVKLIPRFLTCNQVDVVPLAQKFRRMSRTCKEGKRCLQFSQGWVGEASDSPTCIQICVSLDSIDPLSISVPYPFCYFTELNLLSLFFSKNFLIILGPFIF